MSRTVSPFSVVFLCKPAKVGKDGKAPIICYVKVNGQRAVIPLPLRCTPDEFKKQRVSSKPNPIKNLCLTTELRLNEIYIALGSRVSAEAVKQLYLKGSNTLCTIQDLYDDLKEQKALEGVEPYTWDKYTNALNRFLEYTDHKYTDDASIVTYADILKFQAKAMQSFAETTVLKQMKNIRTFFTFGVAKGKLQIDPFLKMYIGKGRAENETEFLTYDEIQKVQDLHLDSDRLKNTRWCFLWQCFTGHNYSDMTILKAGDVQFKDGQYFIKKDRFKRGKFDKGQEYTSVLYETAIEVYKLFGEDLPLVSDQKYNVYIKELMGLAGIDKHITSKSGRKTYANYIYKVQKLPLDIIQHMLGHTNIKQTQEYVKVFDTDILEETKNARVIQKQTNPTTTEDKIKKGLRDFFLPTTQG